MKRTMLFLMLTFGVISLIAAQGFNRMDQSHNRGKPDQNAPDQPRHSAAKPEKVSVSGNLSIAKGMIAVKSDNVTYLIRGINRLIGFVDGLKEGAAVTVEGNSISMQKNENEKILLAEKLTFNGKDYELRSHSQRFMPDQRNRGRHNMFPMQHNHQRNYRPYLFNQKWNQQPKQMYKGR